MRHVFGMAKRHLDLVGAKAPKLELDFLRLAYVADRCKAEGTESSCYLVVATNAIAGRVRAWAKKYRCQGVVEVMVVPLTKAQLREIEHEVAQNRNAMVLGSQGDQSAAAGASAQHGAEMAETYLGEQIKQKHPGITQVTTSAKLPLGIQWDYYGTV